MPVCPNGHQSEDPEYCDVCGLRMDMRMEDPASPDGPSPENPSPENPSSGNPPSTRPSFGNPSSTRPSTRPSPAGPTVTGEFAAAGFCPHCGTARPPSARFCEACGARFERPRPPQPTDGAASDGPSMPPIPHPRPGSGPQQGWAAVINADRAYYNSVIAQDGPDAATLEFPPYSPERRVPLLDREVWIGRHSESRGLNPAIDLGEPPADPGVSHLHAILNAREDGSWTITDQGSTNGTTMNGEVEPLKAMVPVEVREGDRIHVGAWTTITLTRQGGP